jgi:peptide/nickel transport system permease protein
VSSDAAEISAQVSAFVARRILQSLAVLLVVTVVVFILIHLLPGGPARAQLGVTATPQAIAAFNRQQGYNLPLPDQYWRWLNQLLHGNLGFSQSQNQSVASLLANRLPKTAVLAGVSVAIALAIAVPLGIVQAVRARSLVDHAATVVTFVLYSTPTYWLGLILVLAFAVSRHWFPAVAPQGSFSSVLEDPRAMVLPVTTIAVVSVAFYSRYVRSAALDCLGQDYIRTARARGASTGWIVRHHVLRNALAPVATLLGISLPFVVSGTLIVEVVFNYPGMGLLFWNAAQTQDFAVLLGVVLVIGVATVAGSLIADVGYAMLDPRVRYDRA